MRDYSVEYRDGVISVLYYDYQHIGVRVVAKGTGSAVADAPVNGDSRADSAVDRRGDGMVEVSPAGAEDGGKALPAGFRRLADLRKHPVKRSYDDLKAWVGKTIRLDGVSFQTGEKNGKPVITSGEMTFSEFDPSDPERETDQTVTTTIPRGAIRALYEGLTKNPDETIICDVVQSKRGLALQ